MIESKNVTVNAVLTMANCCLYELFQKTTFLIKKDLLCYH